MRKLILAVALGSALSAHAADAKFDAFMGTVVGNSTTVTFGGNGQPVATSSNHLGTSPPHTVGNMGVTMVNGDPHYVGRSSVPVAGTNKTVPVDVKVPISKVSVARGLIRAAKIGAGGVGGIAAGYAAEALLDYGIKKLGVGADGTLTGETEDDSIDYSVSDGRTWKYGDKSFNSKEQACAYGLSTQSQGWLVVDLKMTNIYSDVVACNYTLKIGEGYDPFARVYNIASPGYSNCLPGYFVWGNSCTKEKPNKTMSENEIRDMIASRDGWPTSMPSAIAQMSADPRVEPLLETGKVNIEGPFKIQETPTVRVFTEPKPGVAGQTQSVTETTQKTVGLDYTDNKVKATTTETKQRVVDGVAEPEETTQKDPENDFLVCGLPNTPACRIEEKGTPEPVKDTAQDDAERVHKPLDDFLKDPKSVLPSFPTINWTFRLPSGCAPLSIPAFSPFLQEIDVCQFQPIFHDIMSMIWVGGALFGAIGTFWRNVFAKAG